MLVKFIFADDKGTKQRPGLVLSGDAYQTGRHEAILAAITSNVGRLPVGDHKIKAWKEAGLPFPSTITGIVRTIKQDMIVRRMGTLAGADLEVVERNLRTILAL